MPAFTAIHAIRLLSLLSRYGYRPVHLSNQITGSVIKHIDRLIYHYLSEWATVGKLPASQLYGLESGYVDWVVSPLFQDALQSLVENHRQTAITQEKAYYEATQP